MRNDFDDIVKSVCRLPNWQKASRKERDGAIGVACVLAYLEGAKANVSELAAAIEVHPKDVDMPFRRLLTNGVFSSTYDIKNDDVIRGEAYDFQVTPPAKNNSGIVFPSEDRTRNSWAIIAGLASGLTGLRESPLEKPQTA